MLGWKKQQRPCRMQKKVLNHILLLLNFCCVVKFGAQPNSDLNQLKTKLEFFVETEQQDSLLVNAKYIQDFTFKNASDSLIGSQIFHLWANGYYDKTDYFKAISYYDRSIDLAPESEAGKNQKGISLFDKAFAEYELQNHYKSYQTVKKAEAVLSEIDQPNHDYLLSIYADLGSEASKLGFHEDAEFYLNKGVALYHANKDNLNSESTQSALKPVLFEYKYIYLYYSKEDEKKLLEHLKALENLSKTRAFNTTETLMLATAYNYVGDFYLNRAQKEQTPIPSLLTQGKHYLDSSLALLDKESQKENYTQVLFNIAKYYRHLKQFDKAKSTNKQLFDIATHNDYRMPFFIAQKAMIAIDQGLTKEALTYLKATVVQIHSGNQQLKDDFSNFNPSSVIQHVGLLVDVTDELIKKNPEDTVLHAQISKFYDLALIQLSHSYQGEWFSKSLEDHYTKALKGVLNSKQNALESSSNKSLVETIERIENRLTWKAFLQNRTLNSNVLSDSIFDKEIYLRRQLVKARSNNDTILISELNHNLKKHLNGLKDTYPNIYKYVYSSFNIDDFQRSLDSNTVIIKYKAIDSVLYAFKITNTEVTTNAIPYLNETKTIITNYINSLKNKNTQKTEAFKIFKRLLPFQIDTFENVVILPDDLLHFLPFETLINDSGNYLIQSHNLSYANHLVFVKNDTQNNTLESVSIFSPDYKSINTKSLKGAEGEGFYISELFNNTHYFKEEATKAQFIEHADTADVLHLAMHADINNSNPELSYFVFNASNQDEKLYLEELYALKLKANLAVLSACNTGLGITENAKGSISLQRAFIMAGVPATISSLWEAPDDATKKIMTQFYSNLKNGEPKNLALRNAKLHYIASAEDDAITVPYYWAGFVLFGDYNALTYTNDFNLNYLFLLIGVGLILLFLFKSFRQS